MVRDALSSRVSRAIAYDEPVHESISRYTVLKPQSVISTELVRRKSRFLTVLSRADSAEDAQSILDGLRKEHHSARHHCSAWVIGADRRVQRANDDGEPSGTAGAPMLEALVKAETTPGYEDLSDAVVVVLRWFGGTLLGAGGLVSAYSDSVVEALEQARQQSLFKTRQRMRQCLLPAPFAEAGRWENELRQSGVAIVHVDYSADPHQALLKVAVPDDQHQLGRLHSQVASMTLGAATLQEQAARWVDVESPAGG